MRIGMPYAVVSNALHFDYSGYTPLCVYGRGHENTPEAIKRNRQGVSKFTQMLIGSNAELIAQAEKAGVAARIADKKTGKTTSLDGLDVSHLSALLDEVFNNPIYRDNSRSIQKAIAKKNGLSVAADLLEQAFGLTHNPISQAASNA